MVLTREWYSSNMKLLAILISLTFAVLSSAPGVSLKPKLKPCREQPTLVGKCFAVRGRLSLFNGNPTIRLWRAGTKRMLGVSASYAREGFSSIPEEIEQKLGWETDVWGDFLVCPFTPQRPGEMQMMCIESGKNIEVRKRP
jgi:hypothetical protein